MYEFRAHLFLLFQTRKCCRVWTEISRNFWTNIKWPSSVLSRRKQRPLNRGDWNWNSLSQVLQVIIVQLSVSSYLLKSIGASIIADLCWGEVHYIPVDHFEICKPVNRYFVIVQTSSTRIESHLLFQQFFRLSAPSQTFEGCSRRFRS